MKRWFSRTRIRQARRELSAGSSPSAYLRLARELHCGGTLDEAAEVCEEGLRAYPGHLELGRLSARVARERLQDRVRALREQIAVGPRPALYRELTQHLRELGESAEAAHVARRWEQTSRDPEAYLALAEAQVARYRERCLRTEGQAALDALAEARRRMPRDPRPLRAQRGLWMELRLFKEAKAATAELLQMLPGDVQLEQEYRWLKSQPEEPLDVAHALVEAEARGLEVHESQRTRGESGPRDVREELRALADAPGVRAALYLRGSTALIQGPRGATAERCARAIKHTLQSSRSAALRLGLGQLETVHVTGDFGTLEYLCGRGDAAALWSEQRVTEAQRRDLADLTGSQLEQLEAALPSSEALSDTETSLDRAA
jgi:tetratricopeptide (TPR) repeat protein